VPAIHTVHHKKKNHKAIGTYFSGSLRNILQCFNQVSLTLGAGVGARAEQLAIPRNLGTREWCCLDPQEGPGSTASAFKTAAVHIKTSILILPIPRFPSIIPILANIHSTHSTPPPITKSQSPHPQVPRSPVPSPVAVSMQPGPVGSGPAPASAPGSKPGRRSPSCAAPWSRRCPSCDLEKDRCGLIDRIYIATVDGWIDGWMDRLNDQKRRRTTKRTKMTKRTEITEITKRTKKNKKKKKHKKQKTRRRTRRRTKEKHKEKTGCCVRVHSP